MDTNTRLIASAPELLAFLKMLIAGVDGMLPPDHLAMKSPDYLIDSARALVSKAEGGY